jgi:hypothetical protein
VMDTLRASPPVNKTANGAQLVRTALFPKLSVGDAPVATNPVAAPVAPVAPAASAAKKGAR